MATILVTGGSGFIGSHTCLILLQCGHDLIIIDSFVNSKPSCLDRVFKILKNNDSSFRQRVLIIKGDLRDKSIIDKTFEDSIKNNKPIDAVIHFAGLKSVSESWKNPILYWDVNVKGSINLFTSMESFNCRTIVFSSSATIYKPSENSLLKEDSTIKPYNPYGSTKATIEQILVDIDNSAPSNWRIANLRYFNPVGAHSSGLIGEDPSGIPNNLFPYINQVAVGKLDKLIIFGKDWPTHDGTGIRDYIHVMDLAEAHNAALNYLLNNAPQLINLNIGSGKGTSVLDFINTYEKVNLCKVSWEFSGRRNGDIARAVADNSKAISTLKWYPKRGLEDICRDGWNWQKSNPQGY